MVYVFDDHYLALTLAITATQQINFFIIAAACKFDKVTDFAYGTNFIILAIVTLVLGGAYSVRQIVVSSFVIAWGTRLAVYLFYRIIVIGKDNRFDDKRDSWVRFGLFWLLQLITVWVVFLPLSYLNSSSVDAELNWRDILGFTLWGIGFLIETIADQQKFSFKRDEKNSGHWCDFGLWQFSRHPNYLGEILCWWGIWSSVTSVLLTASDYIVTILSPIFITLLLLFVSGIPLLERSADQRYGHLDAYKQYKAKTSPLFLLPASVYICLPMWVKKTLLCEFPIYQSEPRRESISGQDKLIDSPSTETTTHGRSQQITHAS